MPRFDWTYESSQTRQHDDDDYNYLLPAKSLFNAALSYDNSDHGFSISLGS